MNKEILALFLIILLLLLIWAGIPYAYYKQQEIYDREVMETPILLISESYTALESLKTVLQDHSLVDKIIIERDSLITSNLIKTYQLEKASSFLKKYDLPDVMRIYLQGNEVSLTSYHELEALVLLKFPDLKLNYDLDHILQHDRKSGDLLTLFYAVNSAVAFLILLLLTFLRYHFEVKKSHYWRIFRETGGHPGHRTRQYWLNSLLLTCVPVMLVAATYFLLSQYNLIFFSINPYLFLVQFSTLLLGSLLSRIFLGVKN